ncbi:MaoC/PaaZ C-terminal domain-containing protein [Streptomyces sp. 24-1644]|uniref:MaoC/PaaZ C-terminal domain-containing protein n=1 Tax=Streptomyces sp. 24-1644 TaxID=3457315 RepID=UPI003FA709AE
MRQEEVRGAAGRTCVGEELAPLEIAVTRTLIVAGAVASRDYQDVHHDAELAREKGSPDIFMNILTTNGLVGRFVTDRFGPAAVLRKVAIRLGAPNYPGDTMVLTGKVVAVSGGEHSTGVSGAGEAEAGEMQVVEVEVVGTNGLGRHVSGRVTLALPATGPSVEAVA